MNSPSTLSSPAQTSAGFQVQQSHWDKANEWNYESFTLPTSPEGRAVRMRRQVSQHLSKKKNLNKKINVEFLNQSKHTHIFCFFVLFQIN